LIDRNPGIEKALELSRRGNRALEWWSNGVLEKAIQGYSGSPNEFNTPILFCIDLIAFTGNHHAAILFKKRIV